MPTFTSPSVVPVRTQAAKPVVAKGRKAEHLLCLLNPALARKANHLQRLLKPASLVPLIPPPLRRGRQAVALRAPKSPRPTPSL